MKPNHFKIWFNAVRPQSLAASACPVIIGTAIAYGDGIERASYAILCLFAAVSIHLITNLTGEYFDYVNRVDHKKVLDKSGITQADLIRSGAMRNAIIAVTIAALFFSYFILMRGGLPILIVGILSFAAAFLYATGRNPLGYRGWGEALVFLFFGPVACAGTYYVQSLEINLAVILAGFSPGLISTGVLIVNNIRDAENDRKHNKNTLVVQKGIQFGRWEYVICMVTAGLVPVLIYSMIHDHMPILICSATILLALKPIITVLTQSDEAHLENALAATGKLLVVYTVLFSIAWIV